MYEMEIFIITKDISTQKGLLYNLNPVFSEKRGHKIKFFKTAGDLIRKIYLHEYKAGIVVIVDQVDFKQFGRKIREITKSIWVVDAECPEKICCRFRREAISFFGHKGAKGMNLPLALVKLVKIFGLAPRKTIGPAYI